MKWQTINKNPEVLNIINILISGKKDIRVIIGDDKKSFTSKVLNIQLNSNTGKEKYGGLVIEKLAPDEGNDIIQTASLINIGFSLENKLYKSATKYLGINSIPPFLGHIVQFPESFDVGGIRLNERVTYEFPEFISAEFLLTDKGKRYELNVLDCSKKGLGLLIAEENFDLIDLLKKGSKISDIMFFSPQAMIKVEGTVKHISKIGQGKYRGCYILGIESEEIINSCNPEDE